MRFLTYKGIKTISGTPGACIMIFLAAQCLLGCRANAQQYYFKNYNVANGLVQSQVKTLFQDSNRYIWLGTQSGISRFNGTDFINLAKADGVHGNIVLAICQNGDNILLRTGIGISCIKNNRVLPDYFVPADLAGDNHILKDHKGSLWLIDGSKLAILKQNKLAHVFITSAGDTVSAIATDKAGKLCAIVRGKGIYCNTENKWTKIADFSGDNKSLRVSRLLFDRIDENKIYLLTAQKLLVVNRGVLSPFHNKVLDTLKTDLLSLEQDNGGDLWVGTRSGACYLGAAGTIHFTAGNGLTNSAVTDIYNDKEGIIWLTTDGDGFYKYQGADVLSYEKIGNSPIGAISGIALDPNNNLWFGTPISGLLRLKGDELKRVFLPSNNPRAKYISCVGSKSGQPLLIGTAIGLWSQRQSRFYPVGLPFSENINAACYDDQNRIWIASPSGCYYLSGGKFKQVGHLKHNVLAICAIGRDSLVAGTHFGLSLIVKGKVEDGFRFEQLKNSTILSLVRVDDKILIGTSGEGVYLLDISRKLLKNFSTRDGFRSNDIYSLIQGQGNIIWAGTGKGIEKFRLDQKQLSISLIHDITPNPFVEFDQNAIAKFADKIWLGAPGGIFTYKITSGAGSRKIVPPIINIESLKVIDQENAKNSGKHWASIIPGPDARITLRYGLNRLVITFRGLYFNDPESLRYQYRLTGLEDRFSTPSSLNQADYTDLAPGKYQFDVRAITSLGTTSAIKHMMIEITPAFYQKSSFYVLVVTLIIVVVILIQQYIIYRKTKQRIFIEQLKQQEQKRVREQTAEDFHDDIGNKLARIMILVDTLKRKNQKGEAADQQELIAQIQENATRLFTGTKDILWALDPQNENLVEIYNYIKDLAIDIFGNTSVELIFKDFDYNKNEVSLPMEFSRNISMIFREVLYNILKHAGATKIVIGCAVNEDYFSVEIVDNGKGFDPGKVNQGRGLKNINSRAQKINGAVNISSGEGKGTKVKLRFVVKKVKNH